MLELVKLVWYGGSLRYTLINFIHENISANVCLFFLKGIFPPGQGATIGVDFMIKTVEIDGLKIKVNILKVISYSFKLIT